MNRGKKGMETMIYKLLRRFKNNRFLGQVGLTSAYVLILAFILAENYSPQFQYEQGEPWQENNLIAPFDYSIYKDPDTIAAETKMVVSQVANVFTPDTSSIRSSKINLRKQYEELEEFIDKYKEAAENKDSLQLNKLDAEYFRKNYKIYGKEVLERKMRIQPYQLFLRSQLIADSIFVTGYIDKQSIDSIGEVVSLRLKPNQEKTVACLRLYSRENLPTRLQDFISGLNEMEQAILNHWVLSSLEPNWVFHEAFTEEEKKRVAGLVLPVYGKVAKGEIIISKTQLVDSEVDLKIRSLEQELEIRLGKQNKWNVFFSEAFVILIITLMLMAYLSVYRTRIYCDNKKLALIFSTFLFTLTLMVLASKISDFAIRVNDIFGSDLNLAYIYIAPACIVPIFITNFFDPRTGFLCNIMLALYGATLVQQSLEFAFVQIVAGTVAVYTQKKLIKRKMFFYTLGYILLAYIIAYLAFSLYSKNDFQTINYLNLALFGVNVFLTVIAYNLIYPMERLFGVTSDLTYLELLDTTHPLLKKLARKAPGTFQHSLQVANIAEATVNAIGGNTLLVHVGALYHDIGKMSHPHFFIENKPPGKGSPHQSVDHKFSASIIIGHVDAGVELAHKYRLPREIINFIKTHHGTTRVEYFYRMFVKEEGTCKSEEEEMFRYKGPLPFSKETAVLMIADSVEAASRALKKPTAEDIKELVNKIIDYKIKDGQLEHSNLTFKDITIIRDIMSNQLMNIYHTRIEYPKEEGELVSENSAS